MNTIHESMGNWLLLIFDIGGHSAFSVSKVIFSLI